MSIVLKKLTYADKELLRVIHKEKELSINWFQTKGNIKYKQAFIRCKARQLIAPTRKITPTSYCTEISFRLTDFGNAVYQLLERNI